MFSVCHLIRNKQPLHITVLLFSSLSRLSALYVCYYYLSLGSRCVAGDSGHCTVSGPSDEGVSVTADEPSPACCSSVSGCSSIQLAKTSIIAESTSPVTPELQVKGQISKALQRINTNRKAALMLRPIEAGFTSLETLV